MQTLVEKCTGSFNFAIFTIESNWILTLAYISILNSVIMTTAIDALEADWANLFSFSFVLYYCAA